MPQALREKSRIELGGQLLCGAVNGLALIDELVDRELDIFAPTMGEREQVLLAALRRELRIQRAAHGRMVSQEIRREPLHGAHLIEIAMKPRIGARPVQVELQPRVGFEPLTRAQLLMRPDLRCQGTHGFGP